MTPRRGAFVHVSDLHIAQKELHANVSAWRRLKFLDIDLVQSSNIWGQTSHDPTKLNALAQFLTRFGSRVDGFVVSGDLAATGLPEDLDEAVAYLNSNSKRSYHHGASFKALGSIRNHVRGVPGNHDGYEWESNVPPFWKPGGDKFIGRFPDFWRKPTNRVCSWQVGSSGWLYAVGADFSLRSADEVGGDKYAALGMGIVETTTLAALRAETQRLQRVHGRIVVLWCIHYWPLPHNDHRLELANADALLKAAQEDNVQIILSGHLHEVLHAVRSDKLLLFSAGTPTALERVGQYAFHLFRLNVHQHGTHHALRVRIFDFTWNGREFRQQQPVEFPLRLDHW